MNNIDDRRIQIAKRMLHQVKNSKTQSLSEKMDMVNIAIRALSDTGNITAEGTKLANELRAISKKLWESK